MTFQLVLHVAKSIDDSHSFNIILQTIQVMSNVKRMSKPSNKYNRANTTIYTSYRPKRYSME